MRPITAGLVFHLYCVLVLLCGTTTTRIRTTIHAHPIGLLPPRRDHVHLQSRQDLTQGTNALIPNVPDTSPPSSISAPANAPDSTTTLNQQALIEIIAPNITLFAALDLPPPTSSSDSSSPSDSGVAVSNSNSSTPLLLPTSSLAILPNQIHHVNDSLIFGAGGAGPLTGVLIEWTIGCDLGDSFPIYPPTEKPWIAFISSSLLSERPKQASDSSLTNKGSNHANEEEEEDEICDVSTLISIVQAISPAVTGVIMYQDPKAKVPYPELRRQTEVAIQELHYMFNPPSASGLNYIPGSGSLRKRELSGLDREQIMTKLDAIRNHKQLQLEQNPSKLATPGTSPYLLDSSIAPPPTSTGVAGSEGFPESGDVPLSPDVAPTSSSSSSLPSTPSPGIVSPRSVLAGVMAMGDPQLIKVLHTNTIAKGKAVIAQLTFTNGAFGPHPPSSPMVPQSPPSPSVEPERQGADRSLGLFFWIILGSVVLIVGIWVGFGVVEARQLARRREQIALDSVKHRTVDQRVLDGYKIKVLKQEDIESWDDSDLGAGEDDDDPSGQGLTGSGIHTATTRQDSEKGDHGDNHEDEEFNEKEEYHGAAAEDTRRQRVFARVDPYNHYGSPINTLAMGRKSGSFDETLYGGLESSWSRRPSEQESIYTNLGRPSLKVIAALNRDERCRSWAENGAAAYADYGGDGESVYSDDLAKGYKSHAQEGWTDMQIDQMQSLDGSKNDHDDDDDDDGLAARTPTSIRDQFHADLPAFPAPAKRGSVGLIGGGSLQAKPTLRHKSRFILPRKIDLVPSDEVTSPTIYGDGSSSAGPSTAGFLPPPGWGGDRRRSSLSTVAVPDNGRGAAQTNWTRPSGHRLRQTSMHAPRTEFALLDPMAAQGDEQAERTSSSSDDGRGVGHVDLTPPPSKGAKAKRASGHAHRISFEKQPVTLFQREAGSSNASVRSQTKKDNPKEMDKDNATVSSAMSDCKARFSMIGVDFPDIYTPTTGELSRLSLDADTIMTRSKRSHQRCDSKGKEHVEELQYSDSDSISSKSRRHRKDRTMAAADTMATTVTQRSSVSEKTPTGKQRRKRYDACSVCKEDYGVGDELRELPCEHFFHVQCVDYWIKNVKGTCPICRRDFSEAGTMSPAARADRQREANRAERSSGMANFLSPLAILAAGASGQHFWYATEAGAYL